MGIYDGRHYSNHVAVPAVRTISMPVTDMIALAHAGVKVELVGAVEPCPPPPVHHHHGNDISAGIRDRWITSQRAKAKDNYDFMGGCPELYACQHGDKVYVFAYGGNAPPEIIVDEAAIYPSDALLARLHLMMQHAK